MDMAEPKSASMPQGDRAAMRIAIIGAGMSGICMAIKLREAGYRDVTIYEKAERLGGTWRENTYPGLSCDVPSHLYSYSFALNPDWARRFPPGPEIQAYFEAVAARYGITELMRCGCEIVRASYESGAWTLETKSGERIVADAVITATGVLHQPTMPDIEGLGTFRGELFHTARWRHDVPLAGKRVGVIGTGSTAIQLVPEVAEVARHLTLFQRTAQWIFPLPDRAYSGFEKWLFRTIPAVNRLERGIYFWLLELLFTRAVTGGKLQHRIISWLCRRNLARVKDPALRAKLTPDYVPACKRLVLSSKFYRAIQRPNISVETTAIARIEPEGVRTADGALHPLDVIVMATGFKADAYVRPMEVVGLEGATLEAAWGAGPVSHRSVAMPGFPNFFMMMGPYSPVGNFSLILVAEFQCAYIVGCLDEVIRRGARALMPKPEAMDELVAAMRDGVKKTVWVTGCQSWYRDASGNIPIYPWTALRYKDDMRCPNFFEFDYIDTGVDTRQQVAA